MKRLWIYFVLVATMFLLTPHQGLAQNSVAALEKQLQQHPEKVEELVPKIEKMIIKNILANGPGERFVIRKVRADKNDPACSATIMKSSASGMLKFKNEFPTDQLLFSLAGSPILSGNGSVHRYKGRVNVILGDDFTHVVSKDNKAYRLTFAVVAGYGYIYVRGKGKLIKRDGSEIRLGY
jgi:hypothetical protein